MSIPVGIFGHMNVPAIITALQKASGLNQTQLAKRLGANQNDVSRWLKGREPRGHAMENIRSLALQYGVLTESAERQSGNGRSAATVDIRAELAELFADLVKADEEKQRVALFTLRRIIRGKES